MFQRQWVFRAVILAVMATATFFYLWHPEPAAPSSQVEAVTAANPQEPVTSSIAQSTRKLTAHGVDLAKKASAPPESTSASKTQSLAALHASLAAAARAGDGNAAIQIHRLTERCKKVERTLRTASRVINLPDNFHGPSTQFGKADEMLEWMQKQLDEIAPLMPSCEQVTDAQLNELPEWTVLAAKAGDENAVQCFIGMNLATMGDFLDHPAWLQGYKAGVPAAIDMAVRNGDWHVVGLLENAYGGNIDNFLISQVLHLDPAQQYRYLKLQWLGATAEARAQYNMDARVGDLAHQLSPVQLQQANDWAAQTYRTSFSSSPSDSTLNSNSFCGDG